MTISKQYMWIKKTLSYEFFVTLNLHLGTTNYLRLNGLDDIDFSSI